MARPSTPPPTPPTPPRPTTPTPPTRPITPPPGRRFVEPVFALVWRPMLRAAGLDPYGRRRLSELF